MNITLGSEAITDLEDSVEWYDQQRPGLGSELLNEVSRAISLIRENPAQFPRVRGDVRRAMTKRFPFGLYYRPDNEGIVVFAIMHASRHPGNWKGRQ